MESDSSRMTFDSIDHEITEFYRWISIDLSDRLLISIRLFVFQLIFSNLEFGRKTQLSVKETNVLFQLEISDHVAILSRFSCHVILIWFST